MARFNYSVRDAENRLLTGVQEAQTSDEALRLLAEKGLRVTAIEELNFDGSRKNATFGDKLSAQFNTLSHKVPYKEVVFFTRQLATMVEAGVPLARSLEQLARGQSKVFSEIILKVAESISVGNTFSEAIARHPGAFNNMFVSVVRSGEVSGSLDRVLAEMATYMENVEVRRQKIKGAMRYPTFIASFITIIVIMILWKLVPIFEALYGSANVALPMPTQILIQVSHVVQHNFILVVLSIVAVVLAFWGGMMLDGFRYHVHGLLLKAPIFGILMQKNLWATFCRTMSLLMESGTPILQSVEICAAVLGNLRFVEAMEKIHADLKGGTIMSAAIESSGVFPVLVVQLVSTGEESGRVDKLLIKASEFYDKEINITVDSLASVIEPILIIGLGGIVGSVLIALYLPIFSLGKVMQ
jgi:type IV pilus assembly protein PilC